MKRIISYLLISALLISCSDEVIFDFNEQLALELAEIDQFLSKHSIPTQIHSSNLRYNELVQGIGEPANDGDTVIFKFQFYLMDSTLINTNIQSVQNEHNFFRNTTNPAQYIVGRRLGYPEQDYFSIGAELAREQGVVQMFVPSYLAFGYRGSIHSNPPIPPNSPILVQFDFLEIRR